MLAYLSAWEPQEIKSIFCTGETPYIRGLEPPRKSGGQILILNLSGFPPGLMVGRSKVLNGGIGPRDPRGREGAFMRFNERKEHTLRYFSHRDWVRPGRWAADVSLFPTRAANTYLLRLYRLKLLKRGYDFRGRVVYKLSGRGARRLLRFEAAE